MVCLSVTLESCGGAESGRLVFSLFLTFYFALELFFSLVLKRKSEHGNIVFG